jgi:hypothetical protein
VCWRKCVERQGDYVEKWYTCVPLLFNKSHVRKYLRFSFDSLSYTINFTLQMWSWISHICLFRLNAWKEVR